jgi:hypothetical protein
MQEAKECFEAFQNPLDFFSKGRGSRGHGGLHDNFEKGHNPKETKNIPSI